MHIDIAVKRLDRSGRIDVCLSVEAMVIAP